MVAGAGSGLSFEPEQARRDGGGEVVRRRRGTHVGERSIVAGRHAAAEEDVPDGVGDARLQSGGGHRLLHHGPDTLLDALPQVERADLVELRPPCGPG